MSSRAWAIVWAQWRATRNSYPRGGLAGTSIAILAALIWYGLWAAAAAAVAVEIREATDPGKLTGFLSGGLVLAFLYWQVVPVLMVTSGASLQMRRLRVYPIPHQELFGLEALLRLTTAVEVLIVIAGASLGVLLSPALRAVGLLALVPFIALNLFLSAGVRDVVSRILARRRMREIGVFFVLLIAATPQLLLMREETGAVKDLLTGVPDFAWPWSATARMLVGQAGPYDLLAMTAWLLLAYAFGRWQFERGLRFDAEAARAAGNRPPGALGFLERLFRLPASLLGDPLAAMVEKELRSLTRSPRFRIAFLMGFSFGLLIWFPAVFGKGGGDWLQINYLVILFSYSLMLLSEVAIWNVLGFDRSAAQFYWLAPVRPWQVLVAKNIATAIFACLEMAAIVAVCVALRLNITLVSVWESLLACVILMVFLMSIGNLSSLYSPRPVDPNQTWKRGSSGRFQSLLLLVYPVLLMPIVIAYWARWVWENNLVFYGVLGVTALFAAAAYAISLERSGKAARERREIIIAALAQGDGPVAA